MNKCPNCGAILVFNPKIQKVQCPNCRSEFDPEKDEKLKVDTAKEVVTEQASNDGEYEAISYKCSHCGAELITTDETITTFCSFCRTGTMLDRKLVKKRKPDYVIPFTKSKKECEDIYVNKIKRALFAPKSMIDTQEVQKIRGIYMPYWIYSYKKDGDVSATGSKYNHRSGDYVYYDDYKLTTNVNANCNGIPHDATSNFSDRLSEAIAPYSVKNKKVFSPSYLSGYYADNEDVDMSVYNESSSDIASKHLSSLLGKEKEYRKYNAKPTVSVANSSTELALFPVYFLATKNKQGDRISYAVINGQTGKIAADIPIDFKKFAIFCGVLAVPIFILLNLFLSISMPVLAAVSVLFSIISLIILLMQSSKIKNIESGLDDLGAMSKENTEIKGSKKKTKNTKKDNTSLIVAVVLAVIMFLVVPIGIPVALAIISEFPELFKISVGLLAIGVSLGMLIYKIKNKDADTGIYKPIAGLVITLLVFAFAPASDYYYYAASLFSIVMSVLSFYNIVKRYNILTTRKLPQLGKRGGDENA